MGLYYNTLTAKRVMDRSEVQSKISQIIRDFVEDESAKINDATTADDIEGWDSIAHVKIIVEIESQFSITFAVSEVNASENVGELIDLVMKKL